MGDMPRRIQVLRGGVWSHQPRPNLTTAVEYIRVDIHEELLRELRHCLKHGPVISLVEDLTAILDRADVNARG